ncbi:MAG: hypothetical protein IJT30_11605 [Muribaculaceae bacterium]|nr:hypothetical protein [Muribaculaceae bacterium]
MSRNSIIYGLSDCIYVAQSDSKGGTWAGATEGLRKKRTVYVRLPNDNERNANLLLIQQGGLPVDSNGEPIHLDEAALLSPEEENIRELDERIMQLLEHRQLSSQDIKKQLHLDDWTDSRLKNHLRSMDAVHEYTNHRPFLYGTKAMAESGFLFR